jgi:tetratricopeptide (TPR) repeat protein
MNKAGKLRIIYSLIVLFLCLIVVNCSRIIEQRKHYYYDRGMKLFNNSDYINAIKEFDKALQIDQYYFDALNMMGMSHYSMGDYVSALSFYLKASEERKEDIPLKIKIAECWINSSNVLGARKRFNLAKYFDSVIVPLADKNLEARICLLKYYVLVDKLIEADKMIEGFLRGAEKSSDFYAVLVQFNLKKNKFSEAEAVALKHFTHTTDWMKAIKLIIDQLKRTENNEGLEKIYKVMIDQVPNKFPYQQELANIYRKQGNSEMGNMLFQEMLKSYPDNPQVKSDYVNFLILYNKKDEAESFISKEINKQPENIQLKKVRIDLFVQVGKMQKAYQQTEEMLRSMPKDTQNYIEFQNILADILFKSGEYGKAKITVEEILSKYHRDRDARFLLCKIYIQEKKALPAIGELRLLVSENPTVAEYSYYLGLAHEMRKENDLATKAFATALDNSPGYKEALIKWIALSSKGDSLGEAEKKIKKYLDIHPDDKEIKILQQSSQEQTSGIVTSPNIREKQNPL